MKPIQTRYGNCYFRSRLEARWAAFFDSINIHWNYEHEGYELDDGTQYLPDFFLPLFCSGRGVYVEVKPLGGDFEKAYAFAMESPSRILLAEDYPSTGWFTCLEPGEGGSVISQQVQFVAPFLPRLKLTRDMLKSFAQNAEYRFAYQDDALPAAGAKIAAAVAKAMAHRFEVRRRRRPRRHR